MMQAPAPTPAPTPQQLEAIARGLAENGRVLATLDDWRAIMFVFVILTVVFMGVLVGIIIALLRSIRQERIEMSARLDRALLVSKEFGEAAKNLHADALVQQALSARVESALGHCEGHLRALGDADGRRR